VGGVRQDRSLTAAKELLNSFYKAEYQGTPPTPYPGVKYTEESLRLVENFCHVAFNVFSLHPESVEKGDFCLSVLRRSTANQQWRRINVNLYESHFSLITNLQIFGGSFRCGNCRSQFFFLKQKIRHERFCRPTRNRDQFPKYTRIYQPSVRPLIKFLEKTHREGYRNYWQYYIAYDWEAMLTRILHLKNPGKMRIEKRHTPMSVSFVSNVPGHEKVKCFVNENDNAEELTKKFFDALKEIRDSCFELERQNYALKPEEEDSFPFLLPVVGFNSSGYDVPLLVNTGFFRFCNEKSVVKTGNKYLSVRCNSGLAFIDAKNFMPPDTSYSDYLDLWGTDQRKFFFPHGWYDTTEKLLDRTLGCPPQEAFYNELTGANINDEKYNEFQREWEGRGFVCGKDLLVYYNAMDVVPFLSALEKHRTYYLRYGLDMWADGISLASMADKMRERFKPSLLEHSKFIDNLSPHRFYPSPLLLEKRILGYRLQDAKRTSVETPQAITKPLPVSELRSNFQYVPTFVRDACAKLDLIVTRRIEGNTFEVKGVCPLKNLFVGHEKENAVQIVTLDGGRLLYRCDQHVDRGNTYQMELLTNYVDPAWFHEILKWRSYSMFLLFCKNHCKKFKCGQD